MNVYIPAISATGNNKFNYMVQVCAMMFTGYFILDEKKRCYKS